MLKHTFNNIKTLVKEGFSLVKTATIGTLESLQRDMSSAVSTVKDFNQFRKWQSEQDKAESTADAHARKDTDA